MKRIIKLLDLLSLRVQMVYTCLVIYIFCVLKRFDSAILVIASNTLIAAFSFFAGSRTIQNYIEIKNKKNNNDVDRED